MKTSDAVQAGLILGCGVVMVVAGHAVRSSHGIAGQWTLESALGVSLSVLGVAIVGLWVLSLAIAVTAELLLQRGPTAAASLAARCTPAVMRRLAAALLGINLLAVPAMAHAAPGPSGAVAGTAITATTAPEPRLSPPSSRADGPGETSGSPYWSPLPASAMGGGLAQGPDQPIAESPLEATETPASAEPSDFPASPEAAAPPQTPVTPDTTAQPESPVSPAWEPAAMPPHGGLLVRSGTRTTAETAEVVIAPGDSLWSIVAEQLGPLATAADIAEAWPAWHDTNRSTIGDDPSLLLPGQILRAP